MSLHTVILAGGRGTRLWPISTHDAPKQLQALFAGEPLVTGAARRAFDMSGPDKSWVVCDPELAVAIRPLVEGVPLNHFIIEPSSHGTFEALTLAAASVMEEDPTAVIVVLPSDHLCWTPLILTRAATLAMGELADGDVALIATPAETVNQNFGYIRPGTPHLRIGDVSIAEVVEFVEKPDTSPALECGRLLTNMGLLVASLSTIQRWAGVARWQRAKRLAICPESWNQWPDVPPVRIEDVMEKVPGRVLVAEAPIGWADVGSWSSVFETVPADSHGNRISGTAEVLEGSACVVVTNSAPISVIGLDGVLVVCTGERIVVCHRSHLSDLAKVRDGNDGYTI